MIRCIVVDDEEIILKDVCSLIEQTQEAQLVGAFTDPYEALDNIEEHSPDAVFLDIEMPELNGIELARKIEKFDSDTQIIFITAYEQYALKAFEVSAVHYLLKPLTPERLNEAIIRVGRVQQINTDNGDVRLPTFVKNKDGVLDRISVRDRDNIIVIKVVDILYIKSEAGRIVIVTKKGSFKSREGLKFWETKLSELDFIRCHRSYIINPDYIAKLVHILGEYKEIVLDYCDVNIPISRQKLNIVKEWLGII